MTQVFNRSEFLPSNAQLLRFLIKSDWQILMEKSHRIALNPGDILIHEGAPSEGLYLIYSGLVRVEQSRPGGAIILSRREAGSVLGEVALLEVSAAMASVIAEDFTEAYLVNRRQLNALLNSVPGLAVRFYQSLATLLAERLNESAQMAMQMHNLPDFDQIMDKHGEDSKLFSERLSRFLV